MTDDIPILYRGRAPRFSDTDNLVSVGLDVRGREALLHPGAASSWTRMVGTASSCRVTLLIVSAYRSVERQREIVRRKREKGLSWDEILRVSAYPGFSEHHTGCAVDIGSPTSCDLEEEFEETEEFLSLIHISEPTRPY